MTRSAPILALDVGTTAVKAGLYTADGSAVGELVEVRHRTAAGASFDLHRVLAAVLDALGRLSLDGVRAVAVATVWQSLVRIDGSGIAARDAATWESRQRPSVMASARKKLAGVWDADATGAYVHASYPLLAVAGEDAPSDARLSDIGSWTIEALTGTPVGWSEPIAAGSGAWDRHKRAWNRAIVDRAGVSGALDAVAPFRIPVHVSIPHPSLPPSLREAIWLPPLPDGLCHNLGIGAIDDIITATVGTSGSIRGVLSNVDVKAADGLWAYRCAPSTLALGGAISSAGNLLEWAEEFTRTPVDWTAFSGEEPALPTVVAVPDVFGRRGPDYPLAATGAITGLRPSDSLIDVAAAFAIDMWSSFARLFERYASTQPVSAVRAGGGVIDRNRVPVQLLADALGRPVEVPDVMQPVLRGAALYAAAALTASDSEPSVDNVVAAVRDGAFVTPGPRRIVDPRPAWSHALTARWRAASDDVEPSLSDLILK